MKPFLALLALTAALASPAFADTDSDGDGLPDLSEPLLGTDPAAADTDGDGVNDLADTAPTQAANPLTPTGPAAPFALTEAMVENNYDLATKTVTPDHLEILVTNTGATDLAGFQIYVSIADTTTTESWTRALTGFTVPAGGTGRLHFDEGTEAGHFRANPNSIYATTETAKTFTVQLQATGFAPVTAQIAKDAGGAEKAD